MISIKRIVAILTVFLLFCALPFAASAEKPSFTAAEEWEVLSRTNAEREREGLLPLSTFSSLNAAAKVRAEECFTLFEHTRPNGSSCFTALNEAGVTYWFAGENIAVGHTSPAHVMEGWMNSQGHRDNILTDGYKHLGVGYYYKKNSYYKKHWSQFFIGGCTTTNLLLEGEQPQFDHNGTLLNDPVLTVVCNMHGKSYLPLRDTDYIYLGGGTIRVNYDGKTKNFDASARFPDVDPNIWYADAVDFVYEAGLMQGVSGGRFAPDQTMTRAELVTVLYRHAGTPTNYDGGFTDVEKGSWYYDAVQWAAEEGIVNGVGGNRFAPMQTVSRAETATILLRFHRRSNPNVSTAGDLSSYPDANTLPAWSIEGMRWAVGNGIISGASVNGKILLYPAGKTTRCQMAVLLERYIR